MRNFNMFYRTTKIFHNWLYLYMFDYDTFVNDCTPGFDNFNCGELARSTSARSPYGIYSNTIHGLFAASRSTIPFRDKMFVWLNVDIMSTSRIKSCSVSGVAVSFKTLIATISFVSPLCHSPVKFLFWEISLTLFIIIRETIYS